MMFPSWSIQNVTSFKKARFRGCGVVEGAGGIRGLMKGRVTARVSSYDA